MVRRALRAVASGCVIACLAGCAAGTSDAAPVRVLQLNLCDSGIAGCYTGRSIAEATAAVRAEAPDLITLNEVCRDDVAIVARALDEVVAADTVTSAFQAAGDARTGAAFRCRTGGDYGIGVVSRWSQLPGSVPDGGIYPAQDTADPEQRAWLCLDVAAAPPLSVCTTHLAYTVRAVAQAQCAHLFATVVAPARARTARVVVGADLNLGSGDGPELRSCLPPGSALADDGGQQHVVGTPGFRVDATRLIDLRGSTDHPGLLVTLATRDQSVAAGLGLHGTR